MTSHLIWLHIKYDVIVRFLFRIRSHCIPFTVVKNSNSNKVWKWSLESYSWFYEVSRFFQFYYVFYTLVNKEYMGRHQKWGKPKKSYHLKSHSSGILGKSYGGFYSSFSANNRTICLEAKFIDFAHLIEKLFAQGVFENLLILCPGI